ncbi:MAG TPA: hemerythrin domain-containing protein [Polyangiaceae bacterium]|nr:hemerythrin domain-containing protein [Polyangiaceae bacterium]
MTTPLSTEVRHELSKQHAALEETLKRLNEAAACPDPRVLQQAWSSFEGDLLRHLELEENTVIPLYAAAHHDEAHALLSEHDRIRDVVFELGLRCDLHAVRRASIERLLRMLRSHAEREDASLYRFIDTHATVDTRRHLLRLLVNTVQAEIHPEGSGKPGPVSPSA